MKRMFVIVGLLLSLATGIATAQTRVGVSLRFGDPYFAGQIVIGRPYYPRYAHPYYYRYRPSYRAPRVIVVRPRPYHPRHYHHRGW